MLMCESSQWPPAVRELAETRDVSVARAATLRQARDPAALSAADAVIVWPGREAFDTHEVLALTEAMRAQQLSGLMIAPPEAFAADEEGPFTRVDPDVSADELWGRLVTMRRYRPLLQAMESQLAVMQRLGKRLNQQFVEVDQELRLASRLQRDFLPRTFPEVGDIRFDALFRPATWVSGDVYDVRRLDETTVGFYLADAVGHGVAAGLLTMFIRQAIVGKRVDGASYRILPCDEVLASLNNQLAEQELPNCQFVTACYGVVDARQGVVTFSRGGHPHPIHVHTDGTCEEVKAVGGLLGIMPGETFPAVRVPLQPGEKLIVYSDGLEDTIITRRDRQRGDGQFSDLVWEAAPLPGPEFLARLADAIDRTQGSLQPLDDQSCLVIERTSM
jgi:serine phosphatase RsbU (regulator of sigma subunit)